MTCADQIAPSKVDWLWQNRVPLGTLTSFAGDPKLGKSLITIHVAAAVSRGWVLPHSDTPCPVGSTVLMCAEDDPAKTIVPRLIAAGADLSKVHIVQSTILPDGSEVLPSLRADVDAIRAAAARLRDCRLIAIDPVSAYLSGVDERRNAMIRRVLSPFSILAEQQGAAVVLVDHLTKSGATNGKYRVLGSIGGVGTCRACFLFVPDPTDPARRRSLMLDNGGNLAEAAPPLAYTIEDQGDGIPCVNWSNEHVDITVEEALRPRWKARTRPGNREPTDCARWLTEQLAGDPVPADELIRAGLEAGFATRTLYRAREHIGATSSRDGFGPGSKTYWRLRRGHGYPARVKADHKRARA
jgi:hypothetical protein